MLKQLRINKELGMKRGKIKEIEERLAAIQTRSEEIESALEEAENDDDLNLLDEEIDTLEKESDDLEKEKQTIEQEIHDLEEKLEELNERSDQFEKQQKRSKTEKGGSEIMHFSQVRELLKTGEYYKRADVIDFYDQFKNLRAVTGGELTIPEVVVNRIMDIMGDYTTLYPLVDRIQVRGTARILIDTDTTPATWLEMADPLPIEDTGTIGSIDFDGFKVGKVTFVDNYLLQDSVINLDNYVSRKIARALALALDIAILRGGGAAAKQPTGIIPSLPAENVVAVADPTGINDIISPLGLIDTGLDATGEIIAVMSRPTYYRYCLPYSIQTNAEGDVVGKLPNLRQPDLLGLRVVFNNNMGAGEILYGDFEKYSLIEREQITVENSTHVRFTEDQTAFRGKGRFDGKPTRPEAFAMITLGTAEPTV